MSDEDHDLLGRPGARSVLGLWQGGASPPRAPGGPQPGVLPVGDELGGGAELDDPAELELLRLGRRHRRRRDT